MRLVIRPFGVLVISFGIIFAIVCAVYLKIVTDGSERAKQRRDRSAASSSISHALLVFPKINNGAKPERIADLNFKGDINLAPFRFYSYGEKVGFQGNSVFAEAPMWDGSSTYLVIYFDGTISEE